jgi:peptide/nickel transport system permease protein
VTRHTARRLALLLPTLLGISLATFALLRLIPGDPAQLMLGEHATAGQIAHFRTDRGLDQPLLTQYMRYARSLVRGDWGRSIKTNMPVTAELAQRLPATIELSLGAMSIACVLGIPAGVLAAYRRNSLFDLLTSAGTLIGVSMPLFWLGLLLSRVFGYRLGWLPTSGRLTIGVELQPISKVYALTRVFRGSLGAKVITGANFVSNFYVLNSILTANPTALIDTLRHLCLPSLTLSTVPLAVIVRMTRSCLLDTLAQDYLRTARAKGLSKRAVLFRHAMRNASPPILTVIGLQLGSLFSGAILTETIFSWPGIGQYIVGRVLSRDYPAVQGVVVIIALLFVLINLATDICYTYLDPRIRHE